MYNFDEINQAWHRLVKIRFGFQNAACPPYTSFLGGWIWISSPRRKFFRLLIVKNRLGGILGYSDSIDESYFHVPFTAGTGAGLTGISGPNGL